MRKNLLLLISLFSTGIAQAQDNKSDLVINEVMQSNVECIMDDIHEFPDSWVELYNTTDQTINLKDYSLWDKDKPNKAWKLPDQTVAAHQWVLVYCDKEDDKGGMHASFRLDSGKAKVYLFKNGERVDSIVDLKKQKSPDIAYGRNTDGSNEWGYQLTPTPGKKNSGEICDYDHILGKPVFSELGRVTSDKKTINLTLSLPEDAPEEAYITYTTNGSEPKATGTKYTKAISINKTTVIRAKVFCEGWLSPMSTAQSYIFHPRKMTIPIFSVQTNDDYLNGGNYMGLFKYNTSKDDKKTHDWRRPVNIEFFPAEGEESAFNQLGETRIQGGQSRSNALKSMVFYANKRFDPDNKRFIYPFFPDQKPGISEFKSFSLRDGGNDFSDLYFRDLIIQRTMASHVDLDWQAGHSAVLYINGEYMGMLNIRERSNADNIFSNYNELEDIDMVEISHENSGGKDLFIEELKEGDDKFYNDFKAFYSEKGHTKEEYEEWMDVSEYLNVMVMNLYYGNIDFPGNNIVFWRPNDKDETSGLPKKFRVIVKDTDFGLGLYNRQNGYNTIDLLYNPSKHQGDAWACTEPATRLFKNMMENEDLRQMFIDKSSIYMGDFMNAEGTGEIIDAIKEEALEEFVAHRDKYNSWGNNRNDILNKFDNAKKWLSGWIEENQWGGWGGWPWGGGGGGTTVHESRPYHFYAQLSKQYNLGDTIPLTVNSKGYVSDVVINDIPLSKDVFNGKYFPNRQLTITAQATDGKQINGWKVTMTTSSGSKSTKTINGSDFVMTMPTCKSMNIEAIVGVESGIDAVGTSRSWTWKRTADGILVSGVAEGISVSLHDLRGIARETETSTGSDIILPAESGKMYLLKVGGETIKIQ